MCHVLLHHGLQQLAELQLAADKGTDAFPYSQAVLTQLRRT